MISLNEELIEILKIDSVTGDEQKMSAYVQQELEGIKTFDLCQTGLSLCYASDVHPDKPTLAFYGHLDTVQNQQEGEVEVKEGKIYGCGASDMKGGLAVMMQLMRRFDPERSRYNLIFVFYDKEEGPYLENGLGPVLDQNEFLRASDLALVLEPTDNVIQAGCMGGLHAKVLFEGKSAHSARPWHGENALHKAWPLLQKLSELERKEIIFDGLPFYEVINATQAQTFGSRNSIPADFELNLNYRFSPGKKIDEAKKELIELIGPEAKITFVDECPSAEVVSQNSILDELRSRFKLAIEPKQAWTDIARLGLYGIAAVNFGPGASSQAHQKNEWIEVKSLARSLMMLDQFLYQA